MKFTEKIQELKKIKLSAEDIWIGSFILTILYLLIFVNEKSNLFPPLMADEKYYIQILDVWRTNGIQYMYLALEENKTLPFLYVQKLFNANIVYTRALNMVLILSNTYLLYSISKNKLAFLYPIITIFLYTMWLTVETIEIFIMLLGLNYLKSKNCQGIAIGLASVFRPYAFVYTIFMNKRNIIYVLMIGVICAIFLQLHGVLFIYAERVFSYGTTMGVTAYGSHDVDDVISVILFVPLVFSGWSNITYSKFGFASMIGLVIQMSSHYFLVPYTWFFLAYLTMKKMRSKGKCLIN